jgi:DNA-binding NarL/FixJ family response regulator
VLERLFEDLRHIGPVRYLRRGEPELGRPEPGLDRDQLGLLELLSRGSSLVEAAAAMHLSRRTAQRRLAAARRTLGVQSTAEAIRKALGSD